MLVQAEALRLVCNVQALNRSFVYEFRENTEREVTSRIWYIKGAKRKARGSTLLGLF